MTVGKYIRKYREKNGLSQAEFADIIGIDIAAQKALEKGDKEPDTRMLYEIADATNICMDILIDPKALGKRGVSKKRTIYKVGLNMLYESIHDFRTFCLFLDVIEKACELICPEDGLTVLLAWECFPKNSHSATNLLKNVMPAHISANQEECSITIRLPKNELIVLEEGTSFIKPSGYYFSNEGYGVMVKQEDGSEFELLIGICYK